MAPYEQSRVLNLLVLGIILLVIPTTNANIIYISKGCNSSKNQSLTLIGLTKPRSESESIKQAILLTAYAQQNPSTAWLVEHTAFDSYLNPTPHGDYPLREQCFPHFSYFYEELPEAVAGYASTFTENKTLRTVNNCMVDLFTIGYSARLLLSKHDAFCPLPLFLKATENLNLDLVRFDQMTKYLEFYALLKTIAAFPSKNPDDLVRMMQFNKKILNSSKNTVFKLLEVALDTTENITAILKPRYEDNAAFTKFIDTKLEKLETQASKLDSDLQTLAKNLKTNLNQPLAKFLYTWVNTLHSLLAHDYNDIKCKNAMQPLKESLMVIANRFAEIFNHKIDVDLFIEIISSSNPDREETTPIVVIAGFDRVLTLQQMLTLANYKFEQGDDKENLPTQPAYWTKRLEEEVKSIEIPKHYLLKYSRRI